MKSIIKMRWIMLIIWIAAIAALLFTAPNMGELVREKGQIKVPDGYLSTHAAQLLKDKNPDHQSALSLVLVFHNKEKLTAADRSEMKAAIDKLEQEKQRLGISGITSSIENTELKDQLESKDQTTAIMLVSVEKNGREVKEIRKSLDDALNGIRLEHYFTGGSLVDEDVMLSSEQGLKKTEMITLVFILVVLVLVFRSFVAPLIPLLTVGMAYMVGQSLVSFLVDWFDFPLSNFTQIFLVAVLFGIGTDYCILLLSRFKEELAHGDDIQQAIIRTYKSAGKTVLFSGLAAMLGFSLIGFASFKLYQSAAGVAVGVAALLIALFTLVPFFMAVLGKRLFWPTRGSMEHKDSKIWGTMGRFTLKRPLIALLFVAVVVVPLLFSYKGTLSFNSLNEIGDSYASVKGFNIIADSFGPGEAMPTQIVLKSDQKLDTKEGLAAIERISREVAKVPGVSKVRSITRPLGDEVSDFQVTSQVKTLDDGLGQGGEGITKIRDGLSEASKSLNSSAPELQKATDGLGQLVGGTNELKNGVVQLRNGLTEIEKGMRSGTTGASQLQSGLANAKTSAAKLHDASAQLLQAYKQVSGGLDQLGEHYTGILTGLKGVAAQYTGLNTRMDSLLKKNPALADDADFKAIQSAITGTQGSLDMLTKQLEGVNGELTKLIVGIGQTNAGLEQLVAGQEALTQGLGQVENGLGDLHDGLVKAADGQQQVIKKLPEMVSGLDRLAQGQSQAQQGFSSLSGQLGQLTEGLTSSVNGLTQVSDGLTSAKGYLSELSSSPDQEMAGWNLPEQALTDKQFQQAYDQYMSPDRHITTLDVVLSYNPYSTEAIGSIDGIKQAVERAVAGTVLEKADYGIGGITSMDADLKHISSADYNRTVKLMIVGITLILILLLRSIVMPIYLMISLVLCYFSSMAIAEIIFGRLMDLGGVSWTLPFFGFVVLMALGVDYCIFLMDRFNENRHMSVEEAIHVAMKKMGSVIFSAVIILCGTFAAMMPSGVQSLMQIAVIVISGLLLYAILILPFFVPVMVKMFGIANWWPFPSGKAKQDRGQAAANRSVQGRGEV